MNREGNNRMTAAAESGGHLSIVETNPDDKEPLKGEHWLRLLGVPGLIGFQALRDDKIHNLSRFDEYCPAEIDKQMAFIENYQLSGQDVGPEPVDPTARQMRLVYSKVQGALALTSLNYAGFTGPPEQAWQRYEDMVDAHEQLLIMAGETV